MKSNIKLAGIALMLTFALGVILTVAGAVDTIGETAAEWSPENQAEATIALAHAEQEIAITATYIAVLGSEVVSDTQNTHALMRQADAERHERAMALESVGNVARMVGAVGFSVLVAATCVTGGFYIAARGVASSITHTRQALLPMTRHLLEGPHITEHGTGWHTVTGAVVQIDKPQDALPGHAGHISPTYQALPPSTIAELVQLASSAGATGGERARARYLIEGER